MLPEDGEKFELMKQIESKPVVDVNYRMRQADTIALPRSTSFDWRLSVKADVEKPRYIIAAFQINVDGDQETNSSMFDHCDVQSLNVFLNSTKYRLFDYDINVIQNQLLESARIWLIS